MKRIQMITGHYGSGKTEYAVNLALRLAAEGKKTVLADLDIVNPYFRSYEQTKRLEAAGMYTMGDIARMSVQNEEILYRMFGVNAELLIDHAWGWEPCTISDIKAYRPESNSLGAGQVLQCPYSAEKARIVIREMADTLALELVERDLQQIS